MLHTKKYSSAASIILKVLFGALIFLFSTQVQAQNTKGDEPTATQGGGKDKQKKVLGTKKSTRGNPRFKSARSQRARNVFPQSGPFVNNPSKGAKKEKANTTRLPSAAPTSPPSGRDRAWTQGTVSGTKLTPRSVRGKMSNVYPQKGPFVNNPSRVAKKEKASTVRLPSSKQSIARPSQRDRAWTQGTVSGSTLTPRSVRGKMSNVYSQKGPFVNNPSARPGGKSRSSNIFPQRRSFAGSGAKGRAVNVFPQSGPFVNNPSRVPKVAGTDPKNKPLHAARRLSVSEAVAKGRSMGIRGAGFQTITSQFITRGRKNVYWGKFSKKEKAITTDIAGRKLRTRNYHSPKMGLVGRDTLPFFRRTPSARKRVPAQVPGGFQSATRTGKAWSGDISGSKLRRSAARKNSEQVGQPRRKKVESATRTGIASLNPLPPKLPGLGGVGFINFSKSSSPKKRLNWLGGSASGTIWNNKNKPLRKKDIGLGGYYAGKFQGRSKTGKPLKGGGSVSGAIWSNKNKALPKKSFGVGGYYATKFQGRDKTGKPLKGGGSVSGKLWNNQNQAIDVNKAGLGTIRASKFKGRTKGVGGEVHSTIGMSFTGYKKTSKPAKGGGSVHRNQWNNQNQPIDVNKAGLGTIRASKFKGRTKGVGGEVHSTIGMSFTGYKKTSKPAKGGGSVHRNQWNNQNQPIDVNKGGAGTIQASKFRGRTKSIDIADHSTIGLSFPGYHKTRKPQKGGGSVSGQSLNNKNQPIAVKIGGPGLAHSASFQGRTKYQKPAETAGKPAKYKGAHNQTDYVKNPNASKDALKVREPGRTQAGIGRAHKQPDYVKSPNANKDALKVREPGRAQAGIGNLQVNVKMNKHHDKSLHPDAKFAHSYRDNVKEERTIMMNIKLVWAKLFKKEETQPRGLKQKPGKPRYDPKEKGLWYE